MHQNKLLSKNKIEPVINHLILNANFLDNLGLFHGKMGVCITFAHLARYTNENLYDDLAWRLLDEIFDSISLNSLNFECGLAGVGWGVEYLIQNNFFKGNSADILFELDNEILKLNLNCMNDKSIRTGVMGILLYISIRCKSSNFEGKSLYHSYFEDNKLKKILNIRDVDVLRNIIKHTNYDDYFYYNVLGLENGCAGIILKNILL